jgi:hypothetical protein
MSENLNLLRQQYCRLGSFTGKRTDHLFPLEEQCEEGKALLATAPKTIFIFKSTIRAVFNRPIETKLAVQNYRSSLSSISREATNWLLKLRRIRSPQSTSLRAFPRTFLFNSPKHS